MSSGGLILLVAFLAGVLAVILWPLLSQTQLKAKDPSVQKLERLQMQRETILLTVRDLDFDRQTGKINPADYHDQRERLMQNGVEILRQIDTLQSEIIESAVKEKRTTRTKDRGRSPRRSKA